LTSHRWFFISGATGEKMENLSNWDCAEVFSGIEAASLIVGIDPTNFKHENGKVMPVIQRMMNDWAGYLDRPNSKNRSKVSPIRKVK
jgi:hypothetical protein